MVLNMNYSLLIYIVLFFFLGFLLYLYFIPYLRRLKAGQIERGEGLASHKRKNGTPTMGGIIILLVSLSSYILLSFIYKDKYYLNIQDFILIIYSSISYTLIGLIDDLLIVVFKNNKGIKPLIKFILQLLFGIIFYLIYTLLDCSSVINFFGFDVNIGFVYGLFITLIFSSFSNATNFTDGIDGILSGCAIISFVSLGLLGIIKQEHSVVFISISVIISLLSFMIFNLPNASIFMGNTGSYMIGAIMVVCSIILKLELLMIFIGFIYYFELISVMFQVWYYKKTKGKRLFKMTPFHHHLELSGFNELDVDLSFYVIQIIASIIGIILGVKVF